MAWQDEMNALDSDVAAGRITAEEYRTKRDELLASSGTGSAAGEANPFPPPFRWGTQGPQDADRTQVVRPGTPAPDADRTQVVRQGQAPDSDRTQVVNPDSDRTQVVRPGATPPAQEFAPGSPPWQAAQAPAGPPPPPSRPGGTAPPWNTGGQGFSPRQGPESFDDFRAKPKGGKWVVPVVAVVVAIAVIGAITFFALRGGGDDAAAGGGGTSTTSAPTSTSVGSSTEETTSAAPTTEEAPELLAVPTGTLVLDTQFPSFGDLSAAAVMSPDDLAVLQPLQPGATSVRVATSGDLTTGVWAYGVSGSAAAGVTGMDALYSGVGFVPLTPATPSVSALVLAPASGAAGTTTIRAHYAAGDQLVRVEAYGSDGPAVTAAFQQLLAQQLEVLPAG